MLGCQKENLEIQPQEKLPIETVGDKEALEFLNNLNLYKTSQKEVQFVALQLDKMTREKLINSDQMLTVIPATTIYKDHYSRVLLLKLDGELRSVVFSMYAADGRQGENFSGEILITGLNGEFINGYRARNGTLISKFIKKKWDAKSHGSLKSTGDFCPDHGMCEVGSLCNFCLQTLDEVELTGGGSTDSGISLGGIYPDYKTESGDFNSEQETISWIAEGGAGGSTTTTTEEEDKIVNYLQGQDRCVYNKLKELSLFKETIGVFDNNDDYILNITYGDCAYTGADACADGGEIGNGIVTIKIESVGLGTLDFAATLLHEGIHAEIYKYVEEHRNGIDPSNRTNLLYYYFQYKAKNRLDLGTTEAQHQYMADNFVKPIASAIQQLDSFRYDLEHYMGFGWDGLRAYGYDGYYDNGIWVSLNKDESSDYYIKQRNVLLTTNFPGTCEE